MKTFNFAVPITTRPNVLESLIIENGAKNIVVGIYAYLSVLHYLPTDIEEV